MIRWTSQDVQATGDHWRDHRCPRRAHCYHSVVQTLSSLTPQLAANTLRRRIFIYVDYLINSGVPAEGL